MPRAALSKVSLKQLVAEVQKRQSRLAEMIARRDALNEQIEELQVLAGAQAPAAPAPSPVQGHKAASKGGRGPKRATGKPLNQYVLEALAAAPMGLSIKEIEAKVRQAGYPTKAAKLYNPIFAVLGKGGFKKLGKGLYTAKGAAKAGKNSAAKGGRKRGVFAQTGEEFILSLAKGKGATSGDINKAWIAAGRGGKADQTLSEMTKDGRLKREKLAGQRGSTYRVA